MDARFFSRTYDETVTLLHASREYLADAQPAGAAGLPPIERLHVNCEAMRLTTRLTQIMAWLLAQRAVFAGESAPSAAISEAFRLTADQVCMAETDAISALPARVRDLLDQSRHLYLRVARLDELTRRAALDRA